MNPFRYANIVEGEFFYDRKTELARVVQTLDGGNNLVLYAPRRYGKSSLINKALNELKAKGYKTVFLDFMSIYSKETFIANYTKKVLKEEGFNPEQTLKKAVKYLRGLVPSVSFDKSGEPVFSIAHVEGYDKNESLEDAINLPDRFASGKQKWIIAFDEFQEITTLNGESFEKLLRSCIQKHQNVSYVFLGSRTHLLKDMFNNENRAFYNAALLMNINVIDKEESVNYIISKFKQDKIEIDRSSAGYLVDKVSLIPYYIQFLAGEVWQAVINSNKIVTIRSIDDAVSRIINLKSDYYWELTNRQTAYRKKVLKALSEKPDEIFSAKTAEKFGLKAVSSTQRALEVLIEQGVVDKTDKKYFFTDPMYSEFIKLNL
jgi:AAA+ ATPase superfamily predicted ATPase